MLVWFICGARILCPQCVARWRSVPPARTGRGTSHESPAGGVKLSPPKSIRVSVSTAARFRFVANTGCRSLGLRHSGQGDDGYGDGPGRSEEADCVLRRFARFALLRDGGRLFREPLPLSVSCVLGEAFAFPRKLRQPFPLLSPGLLGEASALPALLFERRAPFRFQFSIPVRLAHPVIRSCEVPQRSLDCRSDPPIVHGRGRIGAAFNQQVSSRSRTMSACSRLSVERLLIRNREHWTEISRQRDACA